MGWSVIGAQGQQLPSWMIFEADATAAERKDASAMAAASIIDVNVSKIDAELRRGRARDAAGRDLVALDR